jgi:hypothetical protein
MYALIAAALSVEPVLAGTPLLMPELATVILKTLLELKLGREVAWARAREAEATIVVAAMRMESTRRNLLRVTNLIRMNFPPLHNQKAVLKNKGLHRSDRTFKRTPIPAVGPEVFHLS